MVQLTGFGVPGPNSRFTIRTLYAGFKKMPPKATGKQSRGKQAQRRQAMAQDITLKLENRLLGKIDAKLSKVRLGPFQVQGAAPSSTGPMSSSFKTGAVPGYRDALRVSGQERLGDLSTSGPTVAGTVVHSVGINPTNLGSRLAAYGHLYNKFCFRKFEVLWVPRISPANANAAGELLFAVDPDPTDVVQIGDSVEDMNDMFSWEGSQATSLYNANTFIVRRLDPKNVYYMHSNGGDLRLTTQGQVYVVAATDLTPSSGYDYGTFYVRYEVDLYVPQATSSLATLQNMFSAAHPEQFDWGTPFGDVIVQALTNGITLTRDAELGDTLLGLPSGGRYFVCVYAQLSTATGPVSITNSSPYWAFTGLTTNFVATATTQSTASGFMKQDVPNGHMDLVGWMQTFVVSTESSGPSVAKGSIFMSSSIATPPINKVQMFVFQISGHLTSSPGVEVVAQRGPKSLFARSIPERVLRPVKISPRKTGELIHEVESPCGRVHEF